jgi:hypothetical protein
MEFVGDKELVEIQTQVEELEPTIAPDGGETVLPLPTKHHR